jgi:hypothetical protein
MNELCRFRPSIESLLPCRRPPTVPWFIVTVIIDALYGMFRRWSLPNFGQEMLKAIESEFYAASAVVFPILRVRISAARFGAAEGTTLRVFTSPLETLLAIILFPIMVICFFSCEISKSPCKIPCAFPLRMLGLCGISLCVSTRTTPMAAIG